LNVVKVNGFRQEALDGQAVDVVHLETLGLDQDSPEGTAGLDHARARRADAEQQVGPALEVEADALDGVRARTAMVPNVS
jgi:hypothetical protein